jgi:regulatory protein YycI of two-component signal transduction system YycFG
MNWGKGITIFLVLFIAFITTLAVILMNTSSELVSEDYYLREVKYGDELTAEQNALNAHSSVAVEESKEGIFIQLKTDVTVDSMRVHLLRGNDPTKDFHASTNGTSLFIDRARLVQGKYILTMTWKVNEDYFQRKKDIWVKL